MNPSILIVDDDLDAREEFRTTVMRLPDVYFLPKPFDAAKLLDLLASVIHLRRPTPPAVSGRPTP
jgi:hypothetical protein